MIPMLLRHVLLSGLWALSAAAAAAPPLVTAQTLIEAHAARLPAAEVRALLATGATIETVAASSGNIRHWVNGADGTFVATSTGARTTSSGTGTWRISDDGAYCTEIAWKQSQEQWCRAVYRHDDGLYLAPRNLANNTDRSFGRLVVRTAAAAAAAAAAPAPAAAAAAATTVLPAGQSRNIQMIYMGGNDCPPCVAWRGLELPKLQRTDVFKHVTFIYVVKTIVSPVPSAMFLPDEIKQLKEALDEAGTGNRGSSQTAIVVDGKIFDYYFGVRSAEDIEQRLQAIKAGGPYPFERCIRLVKGNATQCAQGA